MPLITRRQILEHQYNDLYPILEVSKLVLEALKKLPPDLQLEPRIEKSRIYFNLERMAKNKRL